ncbi:MAG TPA: hypothetical protein VD907_01415 [Verrucomicrobiae bacterium]|nr:hypothetical protein [Verrucomicrobiae bacterium]
MQAEHKTFGLGDHDSDSLLVVVLTLTRRYRWELRNGEEGDIVIKSPYNFPTTIVAVFNINCRNTHYRVVISIQGNATARHGVISLIQDAGMLEPPIVQDNLLGEHFIELYRALS